MRQLESIKITHRAVYFMQALSGGHMVFLQLSLFVWFQKISIPSQGFFVRPPSPLEISIPSVGEVWIFSGKM